MRNDSRRQFLEKEKIESRNKKKATQNQPSNDGVTFYFKVEGESPLHKIPGYELLKNEQYDEALQKIKELMAKNQKRSEYWYSLYLASNQNYHGSFTEENEMALNKAMSSGTDKQRKAIQRELTLYKLLTELGLNDIVRYIEFECFDKAYKLIDSYINTPKESIYDATLPKMETIDQSKCLIRLWEKLYKITGDSRALDKKEELFKFCVSHGDVDSLILLIKDNPYQNEKYIKYIQQKRGDNDASELYLYAYNKYKVEENSELSEKFKKKYELITNSTIGTKQLEEKPKQETKELQKPKGIKGFFSKLRKKRES